MNKDEGTELKTILKRNKRVNLLLNDEKGSTTQSSSIGAVRWTLPDESVQPHSSAPTIHAYSNKNSQQHGRQGNLKDMCSLQECVQFIHHWKEQVDQVCKHGGTDPGEGTSKAQAQRSDRRTERSLEESRKLILEWADELCHVDKLLKETPWESGDEKKENKEEPKEEGQVRIMEWAKELQKATESCGVPSEELGKMLRLLGIKKKRLYKLLPLLEFITWSLLKEDSATMVSQIWLLAKQRTWKAGIPRYIPNSVWNWICSSAADVMLDPMTNHPWLQLSDDQRRVQEGISESDLPHTEQRFDGWPSVLGWEGYSGGRHYWEVDIANNGYWRVGLTTANSKRKGKFPMTERKGYWVLWRSTHYFYACTKPETELHATLIPQRLGVYLDYDEGQISFYNAETKSHIFTFTGNFRGKLYPLFAPMDGRTLLTIIEPNKISGNASKFNKMLFEESPKISRTVAFESPMVSRTVAFESPKVSRTVAFDESPKVSRTVAVDESPKVSRTIAFDERPKVSRTVAFDERPKVSRTVAFDERPKVSRTVAFDERPKVSRTVAFDENPKVSRTVAFDESPKVSITGEWAVDDSTQL